MAKEEEQADFVEDLLATAFSRQHVYRVLFLLCLFQLNPHIATCVSKGCSRGVLSKTSLKAQIFVRRCTGFPKQYAQIVIIQVK